MESGKMTSRDVNIQGQKGNIPEGSRYKIILQEKIQGGPLPEGFKDSHSVHLKHFDYACYGYKIQSINPDGSFTSVRFQRPEHPIEKVLLLAANSKVREHYWKHKKSPGRIDLELGLRQILDFA